MAQRTNIIDSDGVERIENILDRDDIQLEDDGREPRSGVIRKYLKYSLYVLMSCVGLSVVVGIGWGVMMLISGDPDRDVSEVVSIEERLRRQAFSAEEVACAFVAETEPSRRLAYVRDVDTVRGHMARYSPQALNHPVEELKLIGHRIEDEVGVTAYAALFTNGDYRLLSVVDCEGEVKVDWDSYARYGSATWEELFTGKALTADVRVFVRPGDYYVSQFRDQRKWVCFLLETPDCDLSIYAYAQAGNETTRLMQDSIMQSEKLRRHMTLRLKSVKDSHEQRMFVLEDLLAMGWVIK